MEFKRLKKIFLKNEKDVGKLGEVEKISREAIRMKNLSNRFFEKTSSFFPTWNFFSPPIRIVTKSRGIDSESCSKVFPFGHVKEKPDIHNQFFFLISKLIEDWTALKNSNQNDPNVLRLNNRYEEIFCPTVFLHEIKEEHRETFRKYDEIPFLSKKMLIEMEGKCENIKEEMIKSKKRALEKLEKTIDNQIQKFDTNVLKKYQKQRKIVEGIDLSELDLKIKESDVEIINPISPFSRLILSCSDSFLVIFSYLTTPELITNICLTSSFFFNFVKKRVPLHLKILPKTMERVPLDEILKDFKIHSIEYGENNKIYSHRDFLELEHRERITNLLKYHRKTIKKLVIHELHFARVKLTELDYGKSLIYQLQKKKKEVQLKSELDEEDITILRFSTDRIISMDYIFEIFKEIRELEYLEELETKIFPFMLDRVCLIDSNSNSNNKLQNLRKLEYHINYKRLISDPCFPEDLNNNGDILFEKTRISNYNTKKCVMSLIQYFSCPRKRLEELILLDFDRLCDHKKRSNENIAIETKEEISLLTKFHDSISESCENLRVMRIRMFRDFRTFSSRFLEYLSKIWHVELVFVGDDIFRWNEDEDDIWNRAYGNGIGCSSPTEIPEFSDFKKNEGNSIGGLGNQSWGDYNEIVENFEKNGFKKKQEIRDRLLEEIMDETNKNKNKSKKENINENKEEKEKVFSWEKIKEYEDVQVNVKELMDQKINEIDEINKFFGDNNNVVDLKDEEKIAIKNLSSSILSFQKKNDINNTKKEEEEEKKDEEDENNNNNNNNLEEEEESMERRRNDNSGFMENTQFPQEDLHQDQGLGFRQFVNKKKKENENERLKLVKKLSILSKFLEENRKIENFNEIRRKEMKKKKKKKNRNRNRKQETIFDKYDFCFEIFTSTRSIQRMEELSFNEIPSINSEKKFFNKVMQILPRIKITYWIEQDIITLFHPNGPALRLMYGRENEPINKNINNNNNNNENEEEELFGFRKTSTKFLDYLRDLEYYSGNELEFHLFYDKENGDDTYLSLQQQEMVRAERFGGRPAPVKMKGDVLIDLMQSRIFQKNVVEKLRFSIVYSSTSRATRDAITSGGIREEKLCFLPGVLFRSVYTNLSLVERLELFDMELFFDCLSMSETKDFGDLYFDEVFKFLKYYGSSNPLELYKIESEREKKKKEREERVQRKKYLKNYPVISAHGAKFYYYTIEMDEKYEKMMEGEGMSLSEIRWEYYKNNQEKIKKKVIKKEEKEEEEENEGEEEEEEEIKEIEEDNEKKKEEIFGREIEYKERKKFRFEVVALIPFLKKWDDEGNEGDDNTNNYKINDELKECEMLFKEIYRSLENLLGNERMHRWKDISISFRFKFLQGELFAGIPKSLEFKYFLDENNKKEMICKIV